MSATAFWRARRALLVTIGAVILAALAFVAVDKLWIAKRFASSPTPPVAPATVERAVPAEARLALVIGNGAYRHVSPLSNPLNDARLVADTLVSLGFKLVGDEPVLDSDRPAMERAIRAFGKGLRGGAVGLFYYAGHGVQMEGANYLVPVTADVEGAADVKYELISVDYVLDEMKNAGNRLNIVVLDACRNNPFGGRGLRTLTRGLAVMEAPAGTIISYATQPGNTATDGTGKNSPFSTALTTAMKKPGLGVFETFNEVGLAVEAATGGQQQPWVASSPIEGSFQFRAGLNASAAQQAEAATASAPPAAAGAAAAGPSAAEDRAFWESVRDSKSSAELKAYLKEFPHGIYADLTKARLASLKAAASGAPTAAAGSAVPVTTAAASGAPSTGSPKSLVTQAGAPDVEDAAKCISENADLSMKVTCVHNVFTSSCKPDKWSERCRVLSGLDVTARFALDEVRSRQISEADANRRLLDRLRNPE